MGDSALELFYLILSQYGMYETFFDWAKKEKLLPKKRWIRRRNIEQEEQMLYDAVLKFIETDIPPQELKDEISLYS
ncbi:MAG: hypothetical protein K0R72_193 [Clostridia bacterium]|jgi:hypothetical protein|nr:hypothetical protein [Clostridia bacterium]